MTPSPLWCGNDDPHDPHERRRFGGIDYCSGRPGARVEQYRGLSRAATERNRDRSREKSRTIRQADPEAANAKVAAYRLAAMTDADIEQKLERARALVAKYEGELARRRMAAETAVSGRKDER